MTTQGTKGIIWDLDGVILDSADLHWLSWRELAHETHIVFTEDDFRRTFGKRNSDIIPRYWHFIDSDEIQTLADRKESLYREMLTTRARALPGAIELVQAAHAAGWKQALGSSAPMENIQLVLDLLDLRSLLDAFVSGEDEPEGKPAPDIFWAAARSIDISPVNCVVIEDAVAGVVAARAAGMRCIAVTNGQYNRELSIADLVVAHLTEVSLERVGDLFG